MAGSILGGVSQDATLGDVLRTLEVIAKALGANDNGKMLVSLAAAPAVVAVRESGTWTVQPGNTPNTTAWLVNGPAAGFNTGGYGTGLDQHYASQQAYGSIRDRITVT